MRSNDMILENSLSLSSQEKWHVMFHRKDQVRRRQKEQGKAWAVGFTVVFIGRTGQGRVGKLSRLKVG